MTARRTLDAGFTLVELLVVVAVLAVIAPVVTGAVILSFRTVGSTQNAVTGAAAVGAFTSRFSADVPGAETVDQHEPPSTCTGVTGDVVVHLGWTGTDVYYAFDTGRRTLTRFACTGPGGPATAAVLGVFGAGVFGAGVFGGGVRDDAPAPIVLSCGTTARPCPAAAAVTVTLQITAGAAPIVVTSARLVPA